ncbi:MAG: leucine-rich repeat protein [Ruminococcus sp.]
MKILRKITSLVICMVMIASTVLSINAQYISPIDFSSGASKDELISSSDRYYQFGDIRVRVNSDNVATIDKSYFQGDGTAYIPSEVGGHTITGINGPVTFSSTVTDIVVGDTITRIGLESFALDRKINSVTFLGNASHVEYAFTECKKYIKNVYVADSNEYLTSIDGVVYSKDMKSLVFYPKGRNESEVTVDDRVENIGSGIFSVCSSIEKLNLPANLKYIDNYAIYGLDSLKEITIDENNRNYSIISSTLIYTDSNGNSEVVHCPKQSGIKSFSVPDSFDKNLYKVDEYAFNSIESLESVVLPDTVTRLDRWAFINCSNLKKFTAKGILEIDSYCFKNCSVLSEITLSNKYTTLGSYAFSNCSGITEINISASCTSVGMNCFEGITVSKLTIPGSISIIKTDSFAGLKITDELHIEEGVTRILEKAFSGCRPKEIYLPDSLQYIPSTNILESNLTYTTWATVYGTKGKAAHKFALYGAFNFYDEKNKIGYRGDDAYDVLRKTVVGGNLKITGYKTNLSEYVIPQSIYGFTVTEIGDEAFVDSKAGKITLPSTLKSIGNYAFQNAKVLSTITIPNSVETIGNYAFDNCTGLESITMGSSVQKIGEYAFNNCKGITSITVPNSVTKIGQYAFLDCKSLQKITLSNSLSEISKGCFKNCINLKNLTVGSSVTAIKDYAFRYCNSLKSVTVSASVTSIVNSAFNGCKSLESIKVAKDNSLYSDVDGVLLNKDKTQLIRYPQAKASDCYYIPTTVTTALSYAFENTTNLKKIVLPKSMNRVSPYLFYESTSLDTVQMPESITSIGKYAFYKCTALTSIAFPDLVTEIGDRAFYQCEALEKINLNNVKVIGERAFYGNAVKELIMPLTLTEVKSYAFANCDNLTKVVFYRINPTLASRCIGYTYDSSTETFRRKIVTIAFYGYSDTTPATYAKDNYIKFNEASPSDFVTKPTTPQETLPPTPPVVKTPKISQTKFSTVAGTVKTLKVTNGTVKGWSTTNKNIVTVKGGKVTSLSKGTATVTATLTTGKKLTCKVTVTSNPRLSKSSVSVNKSKTVTVKLSGKVSAINNKYVNTKYAKITSKANSTVLKVKGIKKGTTTLKVKVNGVKTLNLKVKIK